ncbi:MAG: glycosyltransferase [Chloroflexota bacterium]|nr:glycosyltransferase [Chloroflexota bacterium]
MLGDFDGVHTRAWLRSSVDRGHDVHAISFYEPAEPLDGVTVHVLRPGPRGAYAARPAGGASPMLARVPRGLLRLAQALRYRRAGLARVVRAIAPDVLHAHFLVEHGFYGAAAGFHPYVVTCWGSDVLVEPERDPLSRAIAKWTIRRADLLTSNNGYMAERLVALGAPRERVELVTLGADRFFMEEVGRSVNVRPPEPSRTPCVLSTRAHEPLYNVDEIIAAFARVRAAAPGARLVVAHGGSQTAELRRAAAALGAAVEFAGFLDRASFRDALHAADVFVSVPSSDGTSVALLQAMAAGCFPIVSDLPTQRELVEDGVNGLRVPLHRQDLLAGRIERALRDSGLRRRAVELNRRIVEERGLNEREMAKMDALYRRLATGSPPLRP